MEIAMKKEITLLRQKMKEHGVDACIVPTSDYHDSEYVSGYFKCREFLSGFTGSAGTLVVLADEAGLWYSAGTRYSSGTSSPNLAQVSLKLLMRRRVTGVSSPCMKAIFLCPCSAR